MNQLYVEGGGSLTLRGQKCAICNRIAFPPNPYGCEKCGAPVSDLSDHLLRGRGRLNAFATTWYGSSKTVAVPYTVGVIALEDGPVIRALLTHPTDEALKVGAAVCAVLAPGSAPESTTEPETSPQLLF